MPTRRFRSTTPPHKKGSNQSKDMRTRSSTPRATRSLTGWTERGRPKARPREVRHRIAVEVQVNGEPENTAAQQGEQQPVPFAETAVDHDESNDGAELAKQGNEKLPNAGQVTDLQDEGSKAAGDMTEEGKLEAARASGETYEDGKARLEMNIVITKKKKANMETMPDCEEKIAMAKKIAEEEAEDNDLRTWLEENKPEAEKTAPSTASTPPAGDLGGRADMQDEVSKADARKKDEGGSEAAKASGETAAGPADLKDGNRAVDVDARAAAVARRRGAAASGSNAGTEV